MLLIFLHHVASLGQHAAVWAVVEFRKIHFPVEVLTSEPISTYCPDTVPPVEITPTAKHTLNGLKLGYISLKRRNTFSINGSAFFTSYVLARTER